MQEAESKPALAAEKSYLFLRPVPVVSPAPFFLGAAKGRELFCHLPREEWCLMVLTPHTPSLSSALQKRDQVLPEASSVKLEATRSIKCGHGHQPRESHSHSESGSPGCWKLLTV
jgi:hypothetical protein